MVKSSSELLISFQKRLEFLQHNRLKQEDIFDKGLITERDLLEVYSAIFLSAFVAFENLIEELFFGLLTQRVISMHPKVTPRINIKHPPIARDIVLGGRNYCQWLPYEITQKRANIFFRGGRPFSSLERSDETQIEKCLAIRNGIAHQSSYSQEIFRKKVISELSLLPKERRPKSFLRAEFSSAPQITYYEQYTTYLLRIATKLCWPQKLMVN